MLSQRVAKASQLHQRIYAKPVAFSSCGIEIRGRSSKLRVNYRTTDEIRVQAEQVYRNPMDGRVKRISRP